MSIIAAGTTTTTALSSTGNTDGTLQFQVNGTTPSVTLNTLGAIGVGSSPNYGSSGQALVSGGSTAAPTWANVTTSPAGSTGQVQYNNAGAFGAISSGTSGQVLTSAGSGAAPTWSTPSAGAMVLLASQTVSSNTTYVTFSNVFSSTYDNYVVIFNNVAFSNSYGFTGGILQAQFQRSGSFLTSGYGGAYGSLLGSGTITSALIEAMTVGGAHRANANASSGALYCYGMNSTSASIGGAIQKFLGYTTSNTVSGSWGQFAGTDAPTTGIRFLVESANTDISQGSFYVYGFTKS